MTTQDDAPGDKVILLGPEPGIRALPDSVIPGLNKVLLKLKSEMWELLRKIVSDSYENEWRQFEDIEKANGYVQKIRALKRARDILTERGE